MATFSANATATLNRMGLNDQQISEATMSSPLNKAQLYFIALKPLNLMTATI